MMKKLTLFLLVMFALKAMPQQSSQSLNTASVANCQCIGNLWNLSVPFKPNVTFSAQGVSHRLLFTNYGFTIPSNATVTGVEVNFTYTSNAAPGTLRDSVVQLLVGGYLTGYTQAANTPGYTGASVVQIGSSTDTWGAYLDASFVNDPGFGFNFKLVSTVGGNKMGFLNGAQLTVYYNAIAGIRESQTMSAKTKLYTDKRSVKISSDLPDNSEVNIYNILGTKLMSVHLDANSNKDLDLSSLSDGMYVYTIRSGSKERSGKFILE
jgi:hypothetical protein